MESPTLMNPFVLCISPSSAESNDDLPEPTLPTMAVRDPFLMTKLRFLRNGTSPLTPQVKYAYNISFSWKKSNNK